MTASASWPPIWPAAARPSALAALREKYPTGALAVLRVPDGPWSDLEVGSAKLLEFVRPRDLAVT